MSYEVDFASAWAKLRHAERHLDELQRSIDAFFGDKSHRPVVSADLDPMNGRHVLRITSVSSDLGPFAEEVSLALGDAVHDLRSALDHLAWQLACRFADGEPTDFWKVKFPICDPKPGKPHKENPWYLDPADWALLHEFQPCKGLNGRPDGWHGEYIHQVAQLREMSNRDKHQTLAFILLVPSAFTVLLPMLMRQPPTEGGWDAVERWEREWIGFNRAAIRVDLGVEVARLKAPEWEGRTKIEAVGEVIPQVSLADVSLTEIRPPVPTVRRLADYVRLILEAV